MSDKVIVSKSKLDTLADTIKSKSGATDNLTLDELVQKVNNIETGLQSVIFAHSSLK